jgi:predicted nucleic acid-binding protein
MKTNEQLLQEFNAETSEETGKVSHEPLTTEKIPREALKDQLSMGNKLVEMYKVNKKTSCSVCHR